MMPNGADFHDFVQWGFYSLIAFCSIYGVRKLNQIEQKLEESLINDIKQEERGNQQRRDLDRLETRVQMLESARQ